MPSLTVQLSALGVPLDIEVPGDVEGLSVAVARAWARCLEPGRAPADRRLRLRLGPDEGDLADLLADPEERRPRHDIKAPDVPTLMERLSQHVTHEAISAQAGRLVLLHACAVADPDSGRCVAFVGPSGMGKTTLVSRLACSWGYVTDETVAVDDELRVWPYPKPLSVRGADARRQEGPDRLGLCRPPADEVLRLGAVILLDRDDRYVDGPTVETLPSVEAVAYLAEQSSFLTRMESPLSRLARVAAAGGGALGVRYREAEDLEPLVGELMRGRRQ